MKSLSELEKGQVVIATVDEVLSSIDLICAIQGHLLRIQNHSGQSFRKGEPLRLQVSSTNPLAFQVFDPKKQKFQRVG